MMHRRFLTLTTIKRLFCNKDHTHDHKCIVDTSKKSVHFDSPQLVRKFPQARNFSSSTVNQFREGRPTDTLWEEPDLQFIFENNRKWVKEHEEQDPEFFKRLAKGQKPQFLLIGCSDSRVPAQELMGLKVGELFLHRNVANLVVNSDLNFLSVLDYAVSVLKVKDVFVLGHYECGGVRAACTNVDNGLLEHWLRNIRDVQRLHHEELSQYTDEEAKHRRLVELNVYEQCVNLFINSIVQKSQSTTGYPRIHGFVYDVGNGLLRKLELDFKSIIRKYQDIYTLYDFTNKK